MAIVARGYGQPESGSIVAGGLGLTEPANPNAIAATLTGTGTLSGTLTAATVTPPSTGGDRFVPFAPQRLHAVNYRNIEARLSGSGHLTAELTFTVNFDAELEELLLVGAI